MLPKKGIVPAGYIDYTVLEGIWSLTDESISKGSFTKDDFVYKIMIRQPDFVTDTLAVDVLEQELGDKNQVILIYCRSGRRSAISAHELIDMGYMNVYDFGGIIDWNYDTVSG